MPSDIDKLKTAVEDLQQRLREESTRRADLERRCTILEKLAYRDPETGLHTREYLATRLQEEINRSVRYPSATTVLTICGREQSKDEVVRLGQYLSHELRESDHVFALKPNSLAILLLETPQEGAKRLVERLQTYLEHFLHGYGYSVTSFPMDTNVADEFFPLTLERHAKVEATLN